MDLCARPSHLDLSGLIFIACGPLLPRKTPCKEPSSFCRLVNDFFAGIFFLYQIAHVQKQAYISFQTDEVQICTINDFGFARRIIRANPENSTHDLNLRPTSMTAQSKHHAIAASFNNCLVCSAQPRANVWLYHNLDI